MKLVALKDIAEIRSGRGFKQGVGTAEGDVYVISMVDAKRGTYEINWSAVKKTAVPLRTHKSLQNGDIIFLSKGKFNHAIVIKGLDGMAIATHQYFIISPKAGIDSDFMAMQLNSEAANIYFKGNAKGDTKRHIPMTVLGDFIVSVIDLEQQKKVVSLSLKMDEKIREMHSIRSIYNKASDAFVMGKYQEAKESLSNLLKDEGYFQEEIEGLAEMVYT